MSHLKNILLLIIISCFALNVNSQVRSDIAHFSLLTTYDKTVKKQDSIFIFNGKKGGPSVPGQLTAKYMDSLLVGTFTWSKYNFNTTIFEFIKTDSNIVNSILDIPNPDPYGYYKVNYYIHLKDTDIYDTVYSWVLINTYAVTIKETNNNSCSQLEYKAEYSIDTLFYYQININKKNYLPSRYYTAKWYKDSKELQYGFNARGNKGSEFDAYHILDKPSPPDTTVYTIKSTDSYNNTQSDSIKFSDPQTTRAEFTFKVREIKEDKTAPSGYTYKFTGDSLKGGAPFEVEFINKSINGSKYFWDFTDSVESISAIAKRKYVLYPDTITTYDTVTKPRYLYRSPDTYSVKMVSYPKSSSPCDPDTSFHKFDPSKSIVQLDSDSNKIEFNINSSNELKEITTVFTPDGDGRNDKYMFDIKDLKDKSIKDITLDIYGRSGTRVYHYEGPSFNSDETDISVWGWDGKLPGTGFDAPEGIYFYVTVMHGWDDRTYKDFKSVKNRKFTGNIYLLRPNLK